MKRLISITYAIMICSASVPIHLEGEGTYQRREMLGRVAARQHVAVCDVSWAEKACREMHRQDERVNTTSWTH